MAKNKEKWDSLPEVEKKDFIARVAAEANFEQQLRQQGATLTEGEKRQEYQPINYYGHFLKRQIEDLEGQEEQVRALKRGNKIKLNAKFLRDLYHNVWLEKLTEGVRRHYRDQHGNSK